MLRSVFKMKIVSKASYMILECIPLKTLFQRRGLYTYILDKPDTIMTVTMQ